MALPEQYVTIEQALNKHHFYSQPYAGKDWVRTLSNNLDIKHGFTIETPKGESVRQAANNFADGREVIFSWDFNESHVEHQLRFNVLRVNNCFKFSDLDPAINIAPVKNEKPFEPSITMSMVQVRRILFALQIANRQDFERGLIIDQSKNDTHFELLAIFAHEGSDGVPAVSIVKVIKLTDADADFRSVSFRYSRLHQFRADLHSATLFHYNIQCRFDWVISEAFLPCMIALAVQERQQFVNLERDAVTGRLSHDAELVPVTLADGKIVGIERTFATEVFNIMTDEFREECMAIYKWLPFPKGRITNPEFLESKFWYRDDWAGGGPNDKFFETAFNKAIYEWRGTVPRDTRKYTNNRFTLNSVRIARDKYRKSKLPKDLSDATREATRVVSVVFDQFTDGLTEPSS